LGLRIKNIIFDEYGAVLLVNGKTGFRRVRIIESVPLLKQWLKYHPFSKNQDSPLWFDKGKFMLSDTSRKIIKRIAKKAGINKKIDHQLFRKSRATELSNYLTEPQLREFMGWSPSSTMPSIYVHLSRRDVDKAIIKLAEEMRVKL